MSKYSQSCNTVQSSPSAEFGVLMRPSTSLWALQFVEQYYLSRSRIVRVLRTPVLSIYYPLYNTSSAVCLRPLYSVWLEHSRPSPRTSQVLGLAPRRGMVIITYVVQSLLRRVIKRRGFTTPGSQHTTFRKLDTLLLCLTESLAHNLQSTHCPPRNLLGTVLVRNST